jgi:AcrR family transcriptional regulator
MCGESANLDYLTQRENDKMTRITKPVEERRQEIIDTARKLFIENGFYETTVSTIARTMNVANGLIFHYFKSKTDILYAVIDELVAEKTENVKRALDKTNDSAFASLNLLFDGKPDYESYGKLIPSLKGDQAIIDYCTKKMTSFSLPLLLTLIERGNADGSWNCEYPKETAIFILQGFCGFVGLPDLEKDEESKIQMFNNIIFRILGVGSVGSVAHNQPTLPHPGSHQPDTRTNPTPAPTPNLTPTTPGSHPHQPTGSTHTRTNPKPNPTP